MCFPNDCGKYFIALTALCGPPWVCWIQNKFKKPLFTHIHTHHISPSCRVAFVVTIFELSKTLSSHTTVIVVAVGWLTSCVDITTSVCRPNTVQARWKENICVHLHFKRNGAILQHFDAEKFHTIWVWVNTRRDFNCSSVTVNRNE